MASLQEIKARRGSVQTTRKITKAMQLVATAKLQRTQKTLKGVQEYYENINLIFKDLMSKVENVEGLFPLANTDKTTYIIVTSDIGLCGGYNSNIIKLLKKEFKQGDDLIIVGKKGISAVNTLGFEITESFESIGDVINYSTAEMISKIVLSKYLSGTTKTVKIIHTKFINSVTYNAEVTQLLPLQKVEKEEGETEYGYDPDFEPNREEVLKGILPLYVSAMIYGTLSESKVSEMSSRRVAMENATDNATELIDTLNIQYNRARQAAITQEINEIVAGADAK